VDNTYHGEEEEMEGDDENENDSDDTQKPKEILTPLWKYVIMLGGGKGGGTIKFTCHHCHKTYTSSYTHVRKHLCGLMHCDEGKTIGVKTCVEVSPKDRLKYQREEEATQNESKRPRVEHESSKRMFIGRSAFPHASGFSPSSSWHRTLSDFLDQGCRDDVDAKILGFSMHVVYHSMFFSHPIGMKWYKPSMVPLKDTRAPTGYDKARTLGLDRERAKIHGALGKITNVWNQHGVSIISDGWTNVKGMPLINILGVFASGAVFLLVQDYSDCYKPNINIAYTLIKTIQEIGSYNVIQVITDNAANCHH
jgi:hypothetical protein